MNATMKISSMISKNSKDATALPLQPTAATVPPVRAFKKTNRSLRAPSSRAMWGTNSAATSEPYHGRTTHSFARGRAARSALEPHCEGTLWQQAEALRIRRTVSRDSHPLHTATSVLSAISNLSLSLSVNLDLRRNPIPSPIPIPIRIPISIGPLSRIRILVLILSAGPSTIRSRTPSPNTTLQ